MTFAAAFVRLASHLLSLMRDVDEGDYSPEMFDMEAGQARDNLEALLRILRNGVS
jgi:hypothetical protein